MKTCKDIMTDEVVCVTLQDNVYEIAVKMKEHGVGFIPVVEGKKIIGVVTDRDLVIRGYAEKRSGSASVDQVMTRDLITVTPDTSVKEASELMAANQIRRLPIVDQGELIGVIAIGDMAIRSQHEDEAGKALSNISENTNKTLVGSK